MTTLTLWQTDDRCPDCGTTLTLAEDGRPMQRTECRTCGQADTWTSDQRAGGSDRSGETAKTTRVQRMAMPLAHEVVRDLAVEHGACIRPIQLRRTNLDTCGFLVAASRNLATATCADAMGVKPERHESRCQAQKDVLKEPNKEPTEPDSGRHPPTVGDYNLR